MTELTTRELLVHLYETAIDAVDGRRVVQQWCQNNPSPSFTHCIAIGKAAPAMLSGALDSRRIDRALLITATGYVARQLRKDQRVQLIESAHPVPEQSSIDAGYALLDFVAAVAGGSNLLFLVSGGASSMVEVPADGVSLDLIQRVNQYLLGSGKDIRAINAWRKRYSKIKGGGLLQYVRHANCTQLMISDVRGDDPAVIGSGLLVQSGEQECDDDAWLASVLPAAPEAEKLPPVNTQVIGTLDMAKQAIMEEALHQGLDAFNHDEFICGDAIEQGRNIGNYLLDAKPGLHVWGGETTVTLPENPGQGGRNLSFALSMATAIEGRDELSVLAAGTDGIDGNTTCAGAVVCGNTLRIIRQMGIDADAELAKANAGMVLMATDELFQPGPTNTNVMDVVIAYKRG